MEKNGRNLEHLHFNDTNDDDSNLDIVKFCPNLKSLRTIFRGDVEKLITILNSCQQLESLEICKDYEYFIIETKLLEVIVNHAPGKFHELKIRYESMDEVYDDKSFLEDLESIFKNWANRIPRKSLSLIIIDENGLDLTVVDETLEVIERFKKLNIIKKFEIIDDYKNKYSGHSGCH